MHSLSSYKYIQVLEMQADLKKDSWASKVNLMSQGMSNFAGYTYLFVQRNY